ncbi:DUF4129 domain-containing transglutaminase family protein [Dictyobacter kobayashii]|uniref:Transglutaminase-like domain-containing protein n=1 Tax=Dictyobacter kobayashii TaxID=2014872 RepID=A0A402AKB4_9CHLR|nr:transglutaminase domain-containing protein [Dictyobacter kobayashii]GCE19561.1 hypothetical protein KDK_33610 [Dictyobacter kobayashii]
MRSSLIDSQRIPTEDESRQREFHKQYPSRPPTPPSTPPLRANAATSPWQSMARFFIPQEGWLAFLLLAIALYSVVVVIVNAEWVPFSYFLYICPVIGLFVGLVVAKLPYVPQALLHVLACLLGHVLAVWVTSAYAFHVPVSVVLEGLQAAFSGHMSSESIMVSEIVFFFYLAFLCFFLGYFGSWLIYRARLPWLVALVYCSIMLVNLNYVKSDYNYLLIVMLAPLILLIARVQLAARLMQWTSEGLYTDRVWLRKMTWRCMQAACVILLLTLPLGWLLPVEAQPANGKQLWDRINVAWNAALNGNFSWDTMRSLTSGTPDTTNYFGSQLTISNSIHLPDGEVLSYTASDKKSHYLESSTFNQFSNNTWTTSPGGVGQEEFTANARLPLDNGYASNNIITTTVNMTQAIGGSKNYLFAPAQPIFFSVPTQIYTSGGRGGSTTSAWTQLQPLTQNASYSVVSSLTHQGTLTDVPLPDDNTEYWRSDPYYYWLSVSYLGTPQDLSPQVHQTAAQWTAGATNAYEALKQIEAHLNDSRKFKYSIDNAPIPPNKDVVDWLLETHTGYCTYYASAMAVMGRLLHIPTRLVTGFSSGKYDVTRQVWSVAGSDAHSWVQAYFPGYGWLDFDPTPGFSPQSQVATTHAPTPVATQPALKPTPTLKVVPTPVHSKQQPKQAHGQAVRNNDAGSPWMLWLALGLLFCAFIFFIAAVIVRRRRLLDATRPAVSGLFWRACWLASWVGLGPKSWQTPYEYTEMLSRHLPQKEASLWELTELFVRERWGAPYHAPGEHEAISLARSWPSLRSRLLRLFFFRKGK